MALNSEIAWCDHTGNLWWGCTEVHAGCDNCYARVLANRWGTKWGEAPRRKIKAALTQFLGMQARAQAAGRIDKVFVGSMMDIFEKSMPMIDHQGNALEITTEDLRDQFFEEVVPACPNLMLLLLTKRPSNINKMSPPSWRVSPPDNVIFGTSIVNEKTAGTLSKQLQAVNGRKFYSIEPQLDFIDFGHHCYWLQGIDWVIQGGESGPGKRPFNTDWARDTRDVCADFNIPYFFKQVDKVQAIPEDLMVRQFPAFFDLVNY